MTGPIRWAKNRLARRYLRPLMRTRPPQTADFLVPNRVDVLREKWVELLDMETSVERPDPLTGHSVMAEIHRVQAETMRRRATAPDPVEITMHPDSYVQIARSSSPSFTALSVPGGPSLIGVPIYLDRALEPGRFRVRYSDGSERFLP